MGPTSFSSCSGDGGACAAAPDAAGAWAAVSGAPIKEIQAASATSDPRTDLAIFLWFVCMELLLSRLSRRPAAPRAPDERNPGVFHFRCTCSRARILHLF